jgi:hypothetical protein
MTNDEKGKLSVGAGPETGQRSAAFLPGLLCDRNMKTPAREPAFHKTALSFCTRHARPYTKLSAVVVAVIAVSIIMTAVPALVAVLSADVMAVDPVMPARHVARDPDHFIVVGPIARAMVVEWLVANLDCNALRSNSGR